MGWFASAGLPRLLVPAVRRGEQAKVVLARLVADMERRDGEGRSEPPLLAVLGELSDPVQVGEREVEGLMRRLQA